MSPNPNLSWEVNHLNHAEVQRLDFLFEHSLNIQPKSTNQESSGRCWLFAALNMLRVSFIEAHDLPLDFEFSQNYLFFWDKYERAKYFLRTFPHIKNAEDATNTITTGSKTSRLVDFMLRKPVVDGGQWNMFTNLVNKYGLVPKSCYGDTYGSKNSMRLNMIVNNKLKEAIAHRTCPDVALAEIYDILVHFLGKPPDTFQWRYQPKSGNNQPKSGPTQINIVKDLTPVSFYESYVKPVKGGDVNDYISIINDPRNPYDQFYTVDYLNNMVGGQEIMYLNQPIDVLAELSKECILNNLPVWFGSDVMPYTSRQHCVSGPTYFDYPQSSHYSTNHNTMTKKERLETLDSMMTHAMVFHGFDFSDPNEKKGKWKVENSWGTDGPYGGYYIADHAWFENYVYQVNVHKSIAHGPNFKLPTKTPSTPVTKLPPWDAFGSLASHASRASHAPIGPHRNKRTSLKLRTQHQHYHYHSHHRAPIHIH